MKYLLLFILLCVCGHFKVDAQGQKIEVEETSAKMRFVGFDVLNPILNLLYPRWRVSYLQYLNDRYGVGAVFGYTDQNIALSYTLTPDMLSYNFWDVRLKVYRLFNPTGQTSYVEAELFFTDNNVILKDGNFVRNGRTFNYDQTNFNRQKYGINLKYGRLFDVFSKFKADVFIGLGFRVRNILYSNTVNLSLSPTTRLGASITDLSREGEDHGLNFTAGVHFLLPLKH